MALAAVGGAFGMWVGDLINYVLTKPSLLGDGVFSRMLARGLG